MSRPLKDLDRALGTVGLGQTCLALLARRHGAVAEQPAVALVILAEQLRDEVVAAAVPLAALGADLHFHRIVPVCRSGPARWPCLHHGCSLRRTPNSGPVKMGQLPHARIIRNTPSSGVVRAAP